MAQIGRGSRRYRLERIPGQSASKLVLESCLRGHDLEEGSENRYERPDGRISCRVCNAGDQQRHRKKKAAELAQDRHS